MNNRERDLITVQKLEAQDWNIIIVWECEVSKSRIQETMERIEDELKANGEKWRKLKERYRMNREKANEERRRRLEAIAAAEAELEMKFRIPQAVKRMSYEDE